MTISSQPLLRTLVVVATVAALLLVVRGLRLSADIADLLPNDRQSAALRTYARVFGGGSLGVVLVRGARPEQVAEATEAATEALSKVPGVRSAVSRVQPRTDPGDPTVAWAWASPRARARLAQIMTDSGMRERLHQTKLMLLAPGAASLAPKLVRDPLRLAEVPFEGGMGVASGLRAASGGALVADQGRARLVLIASREHVLRGRETKDFVRRIQRVLQEIQHRFPSVSLKLTGGNAIAAATEKVIRHDMWLSGILSTVLAALAFVVTFRRGRALLAILPPLALGTLWTAAAASVGFSHLSAISVAFMAVVVGVGMDTGIHVYAAVQRARGDGLSPTEAALAARKQTARPTLVAAAAAALAFGTLTLSEVPALRQFGLLCGAGELLTALAILAVTPSVGAWLERSAEPPTVQPWQRWATVAGEILSWRGARLVVGGATIVPVVALLVGYGPKLGDAVVAVRPDSIEPLETQRQVDRLFQGGPGQWVVLSPGASLAQARRRADHLFEGLASRPDNLVALESLTRLAPSEATQRARLRERDELDLPKRADELARHLRESGFNPEKFSAALYALRHPSSMVRDALDQHSPELDLLRVRFVGREGARWWVASYVRPKPGKQVALERQIHALVPEASITGYARLDSSLKQGLRRDVPRMVLAALLLVGLAMALSLRNLRHWTAAIMALGFEIAWVLVGARWLGVSFHIYDAFVLPVLLGVTVDESMFLLHESGPSATWDIEGALRRHGKQVTATAWTTAAGFGALMVCEFPGLRDMGKLGVAGVMVGWVASLVVVPVIARSRPTK